MTQSNCTPLVSIVVPLYNMAKYVQQCMKSLHYQTLENIEIIVVNDGSTDESPEIVRAWADLDSRIRVIDKPNSGYGASMNRGMDEARGTYVGFVDPDDYVDLVMFEKLANAAEKNEADLVKCNYYMHFEDHEDAVWNLHGLGYNDVFDCADRPQIITRVPSIWAALYRRSFLNEHGLRLTETPGVAFQDTAFCLKVLFEARRTVLLRRPLLHYRADNPTASTKALDKVYAVCDEMNLAEAYLNERPERAHAFAPWLPVCKWGKYRWNYNRIAKSARWDFIERVREEFCAFEAAGLLDAELLEPVARGQVLYLIDAGVLSFVRRYPSSIPYDDEPDPAAMEYAAARCENGTDGAFVPDGASYLNAFADARECNGGSGAQNDAAVMDAPLFGKAARLAIPAGSSPAVTVIVPVYNAQRYVGECIESLKQQTFGDFEALIIDDCSTDGSLAEIERCVEGDPRFTVWSREENGGPSAARNEGLDRACGEYIAFLDGDDYYAPRTLEKLVHRARIQNLDELYYSGSSFADGSLRDGYYEDYSFRESFDDVATGRALFTFFEQHDQFFTQGSMRMVRRGLIEDNHIRFKEGILHEDILFTFQTLVVAQRSSFLNEPLYQRRMHGDSIMGKMQSLINVVGHFVSLQAMEQWMREHADECDEAFCAAFSSRVNTWRKVTYDIWVNNVSEDERQHYLAELSAADRTDFYCDIIGVGAAQDDVRTRALANVDAAAASAAESVRNEYLNSKTYRLGNAFLAIPRAIRDRVVGANGE